eukprot:TRINITY_DN27465_c0_g1_i4.p2 TRINITY_DN27465_c0_g1~~TRINITY_DN27465_c0_g1_i4.p2  ORF type:complete len:144 (-),score=9.01 TRINITY_DN27465_c0_g1_i4:82-513(-)
MCESVSIRYGLACESICHSPICNNCEGESSAGKGSCKSISDEDAAISQYNGNGIAICNNHATGSPNTGISISIGLATIALYMGLIMSMGSSYTTSVSSMGRRTALGSVGMTLGSQQSCHNHAQQQPLHFYNNIEVVNVHNQIF